MCCWESEGRKYCTRYFLRTGHALQEGLCVFSCVFLIEFLRERKLKIVLFLALTWMTMMKTKMMKERMLVTMKMRMTMIWVTKLQKRQVYDLAPLKNVQYVQH